MNNLYCGRPTCLAFLCVLAALVGTSASAGVLVMKNGDRITGDIKKMYDGDVFIEPEYADEFKVSMANIEYIESDKEFEYKVSLREDKALKFVGEGADGKQLVEIEGQEKALALTSLEEVNEPDEYFDWGATVDFSLNMTRGNTDTDNNKLAGAGNMQIGDHRHFLGAQFIRERTDGSTTKKQDLVGYDYNWLFNRPWFASFNASYERDPIKELDYRWILGLNLGRDIWNSARRFWSVQAGPGVQFEDRAGNSESQAVAQWRMRFRYDIPQVKDMDFFHNNGATYNLSGEDNTVVKTSTGLNWEFLDDWYMKWSYDWDWESDPSDDAEKADSTLRFGLGKAF